MKVNIDSKKISSSSDLVIEMDNLEDNLEKSIKQLKQQLMYGNNSCFLVSGYRGTGKTS